MTSKLLRIFLVVLAVAALCSCSEEAAARVKRRVKPRPKKPLTLEELRYEVSESVYNNCTIILFNWLHHLILCASCIILYHIACQY